MAASTGYILAAGAVTLANEAIFAPLAEGDNAKVFQSVNWRVVPATALAAIALAALDGIAPPLGKGLAIIALFTAVVVPFGNAPSILDNANKVISGAGNSQPFGGKVGS